MLRRLQNFSEEHVFRQIDELSKEYGGTIFQKIRIADVVDIQKLKTGRQREYALMAHLDFIVASSDKQPLFSIEYDGTGHDSKNDSLKDEICAQANLTLFRVGHTAARSSCMKLSFLNYIVHLWFLGEAFENARREGHVPINEPFSMLGFLKPNAKHVFDSEFNFFGQTAGKINKLVSERKLVSGSNEELQMAHLKLSYVVLRSDQGSYWCYTSMPLDRDWVVGSFKLDVKIPSLGGLADVPFSILEIGQFCEGMALLDLYEGLLVYSNGGRHIMSAHDDMLQDVTVLLQQGYQVCLAGGGPDQALLKKCRMRD